MQRAKPQPAPCGGQFYRFQVDGPAKPKGRPRFDRRTGRVHTPKKTERAERDVAWWANDAGVRMIDGPVVLDVIAFTPPPKSPKRLFAQLLGWFRPKGADGDNILKLVSDALNGIAYADDRQIVIASVAKLYGRTHKTIITVRAAMPSDLPMESETERAGLAVTSLADIPRASDGFQVALPLGDAA